VLWLAAKAGVDRKLTVMAACDCAELALRHVPDGEDRPQKAIEAARAWCLCPNNEAARDAAGAARDAAWAAGAAAWAAGDAAWAARAAGAAAWAAAEAAEAAGAAEAACDAARDAEFKRCADLVRQRIPFETMRDAVLSVEVSA